MGLEEELLTVFPGVRLCGLLQAVLHIREGKMAFAPFLLILLTGQTLPDPAPRVAAKTREKELSKAMGQAVNHLKLQFPSRRRKLGVPSPEPGTRGRRTASPSCSPVHSLQW